MIELTPSWVSAGIAAFSVVGTGIAAWLRSVDAAQEARIKDVKATQKILFDKHDSVSNALQNYKLEVATTYVNREILKEALAPINKSLENIQHELHERRQ